MPSRTACLAAFAGAALNISPLAAAQPVGLIEPEPEADRPAAPIARPAAQPADQAPQAVGPEAIRPEDGPAIAPEIPTTVSFFSGLVYDGSSDTNGSAGELRTLRVPARLGYSTPINNKNILRLSARQTTSLYDFQPFSEFPGSGDPIDVGLSAGVGATLVHLFDRRLSGILGVNIGFDGEVDAEFEDSITAGGVAGLTYRVNQDLLIGASLLVQSRLEEDVIAFPVPVVDWQFSDYWNLKVGRVDQVVANLNGGIALTHTLTDDISVGGFAGVTFHQFRLADDNSSVPGGILEDAVVPVGSFISYQHSPNVVVFGTVQGLPYREVNIQTSGGNSIADVELQPTLSASLGVRIKL
ncbi:MAG: hypothetical protein AAFR96_05055 [Planctomycetota bacterium]